MKFRSPSIPDRYQDDNPLIKALFVWPATTPEQAFSNEWFFDAIHKASGSSLTSSSASIKLKELREMPRLAREDYMKKLYAKAIHATRSIHVMEIGSGNCFYGRKVDLLRTAAEIGVPPNIMPLNQFTATYQKDIHENQ